MQQPSEVGSFSAAGFLVPAALFPPQASCPQPPSGLIWLLVLLLPYPCRFCGPWPVEEWCSRAWSLRMGEASTWFPGFSEDSSSGHCDESSCVVLGVLFGFLGFSRFCKGLCWASCAWGGCSYSRGRLLYAKCRAAHLAFWKRFQSKCRNVPHGHQEQVSKCSARLH